MAGYAKLLRSIWQDDDFRLLPSSAQRIYMMLMSQPDISHCGVLPLTPGRWGRLACDTDADSVRRDLTVLTRPETLNPTLWQTVSPTLDRTVSPFVLIDEGTEEVLVRSYAKHDEGYRVPNIRTALFRSTEEVMSVPLRQTALTLIRTLCETVRLTDDETVWLSQQPAAISIATPSSSSQQPDPSANGHTVTHGWTAGLPKAAAAALDALLRWKCVADDPRKPSSYARDLKTKLPKDHNEALLAYVAEHPGAGAVELAVEVLDMSGADAQGYLEDGAA